MIKHPAKLVALLEQVQQHLDEGKPVRTMNLDEEQSDSPTLIASHHGKASYVCGKRF